MQCKLLWNALPTIYNIFLKHHLDYGDVVYDQPNNEFFSGKLEYIQYNAALAITWVIKCTSQEVLYKELVHFARKVVQGIRSWISEVHKKA